MMSKVITKGEVMSLLLEACCSFREPWKAYVAAPSYQEGLLYIDLGKFAHHLVQLMRRGSTGEVSAVFEAVERLCVDSDSYVREAATIGLLEGIQNVASNTGVDPQVFIPHLKPVSAKWWAELNDFWDGKSSYVVPASNPRADRENS